MAKKHKEIDESVIASQVEEMEKASGLYKDENPQPVEQPMTEEDVRRSNILALMEQMAEMNRNVGTSSNQVTEPQHNTKEYIKGTDIADIGGYIPIPMEELLSKGNHYPEGFQIYIRSASLEEIREWSMLNDDSLMMVNEAIQMIIKKCTKFTLGGYETNMSYLDIKEIDKFYIALAIRELTYPEGSGNELIMKLPEGGQIAVYKEMLDFINIPEELEKHYNSELGGYTFTDKIDKTQITIYLPSLGVSNWVTKYALENKVKNLEIDQNFLQTAVFLIKSSDGFTEADYEEVYRNYMNYSPRVISLLSEVRAILTKSITTNIKYLTEAGAERTAPISFQGGIRSLFLVPNALSLFD